MEPARSHRERRSLLDEFFGIDLRSLAVFRIAVAGALLYDVLDRSTDLSALYTNLGVLPSETLIALWGKGAILSPFYQLSDYPAAIVALFALQCGAAIAMGLGWKTRWAGWLCWFLLVSVQIRNPMAAGEGCDRLLPQVLFLGLLLPLEAKWSLDARRRGSPVGAEHVLSFASAALILQLCLLYWVTGFMKNGETWWNGTAVYYALHLDYWVSPFGVWLREYSTVTQLATWGTVCLERFGPFIAFVPFWTGQIRVLLIAVFIIFHLSLASALNVGPFPLYSLIMWPVLLPTWFWDELLPRLRSVPPERAERLERVTLGGTRFVQFAATALLVLMAIQAADVLRLIPNPTSNPIKFAASAVGKVLRFSQNWRMFAPDPPDRDVWPVIRGELKNGALVDPLTGEPTMRTKPTLLFRSYPSFRWRVYYAFLMQAVKIERMRSPLHLGLSEYFCRSWNAKYSGDERLDQVEIQYWIEWTDKPNDPIERMSVFEHTC